MTTREDKLWSAYLDGELNASEASEFDQTLDAEARDRLAKEMRFEKGLAEVLGGGSCCPVDLWNRISAQVRAQTPKRAKRSKMDYVWYAVTAVAASLAIAVGMAGYNWYNRAPEFLLLSATTVEEFENQVSFRTADAEELTRYLHSHNLAVNLADPNTKTSGSHPREVIGARQASYHGEEVMEVYLDCCGLPAKIVLVPKGGTAAQAIGRAVANGKVRDAKPVGDYVAALVTHHGGASNMLELLSPDWEYALRQV